MDGSPSYLYSTLRCDGYIGLDSDDSDYLTDYRNHIIKTELFTVSDEEYAKNA